MVVDIGFGIAGSVWEIIEVWEKGGGRRWCGLWKPVRETF